MRQNPLNCAHAHTHVARNAFYPHAVRSRFSHSVLNPTGHGWAYFQSQNPLNLTGDISV